jgi:hypothetical protein
VNAMFERDATLTMVLVPNTDLLIFLNPSTDPYTNSNGSTMLGENQTTCNTIIGSANYDIGHVFSTGGGGVASLNSPCTSSKARGVTGQPNPVGDPFDIDYVAHEMGHQYGANHTQNNNCNRASHAAYEPGSASTIMGYAGICSPNVQNNSDALFHGFSIQEMMANITVGNSSTCPQTVIPANAPPFVDAGPDRIIPRSTPFILTATAGDPNPGNALTYTWEQMDNQVSTQPPLSTNTGGPNFRALLPSTSPSRYMPALPAVINNTTPVWEVLSSVSRTFNFRVTVRDNFAGAGCNAQDNMVVTVSGTTGPFLVTQPNTNVSWQTGTTQTVTWDVAGTSGTPVNCANVDILLSVDGGFNWPYVLATATPNDGSQAVVLPVIPATSMARIMVRANGNIFYDISNQNFAITTTSPGVVVNDNVCNAAMLEIGTNGPYTNVGATVQTGEPSPPLGSCNTQFSWCSGGGAPSHTVWFKFVAPPSGRISLNFGTTANWDSRLALWSAPDCGALLTNGATLLAANDDITNASPYHAAITPICVIPGLTYFVQVDGYANTTNSAFQLVLVEEPSCMVQVSARVFLDAPYNAATGLMADNLRSLGMIPLSHPYGSAPWSHIGMESRAVEVTNVTGANAIVDWILLELRSASSPSTIVARRAALLQRDGDIVDTDGVSPVRFSIDAGNYRLVVRHRNHMAVITANSFALSSTPTAIDLTLATIPLTHGAAARKSITGVHPTLALWGGNANGDDKLAYYGTNSDRQTILSAVGSALPFDELINVYDAADVNMDGVVRYYGTNADRQFVLLNVGSSDPFGSLELPVE